jgi:hypothetical protein
MVEPKFFFLNTLFHWTVALDFVDLPNYHDFLNSLSFSG